jgi:Fungal N-terminal domain of STAND proteins
MDPLSLAASVIAIIQLADRIISVCKDYVTTVKDAPNDLRTIFIEVGSVKCVFELLELVIPRGDNDNAPVILEKLRTSNGPIEGCKQALTALDSLFPLECPARGKRRIILRSLKDLAWPFKEGKARRLLEDIGRHKATISLALTTETA